MAPLAPQKTKPIFGPVDFMAPAKKSMGQVVSSLTSAPVAKSPSPAPAQTAPMPTIGDSFKSAIGIPTANAAAPTSDLIQKYMSDPSISPKGKKAMQDDLESGAITPDKAEGVITEIYRQKGATVPSAPSAPILQDQHPDESIL